MIQNIRSKYKSKQMAKKNQLSYKEIEENLKFLKTNAISSEEVGYHILLSFGKSNWDIQRYKEGKGILKTFDGLLIKGLFCYKSATTLTLISLLDSLKKDQQVIKAAPKIIAVSDGERILAYDMREKESYENPLSRLYCDFEFFYPLMGIEKVQYIEESPADIKAAEKLAKLHDELRAYNDFDSENDLHDLNIFITRLLFCFFAEDTGIFPEQLFTSSIERFTKPDGSDISDYLADAFRIMDVQNRTADIPQIINQFPYVNGGLFSKNIQIPKMGAKARKIILGCGELDWKNINPDIFGSMIQAVVNPEERATQGMHYTSVPNIMKVIRPLFLDNLTEVYNALLQKYQQLKSQKDLSEISLTQFYKSCKTIKDNCNKLLLRISKMKFFDPACGSGNFLIITYKALRFLEIDILKIIRDCTGEAEFNFINNSCITLKQFYGIELLDFPHEVAMLSLWLAEHQMNRKLNEEFKVNIDALPLHNINQIVCGNACRIDWNTVCPHTTDEEVYVFGNPPYLGARLQSEEQKIDMEYAMGEQVAFNNLDYITSWIYKGAIYINGGKSKAAFVCTNSVCQGEQVPLIWPCLLRIIEIEFAYRSFKWTNNAKNNAGVSCVIIGMRNVTDGPKFIYSNDTKVKVNNINPYLMDSANIIVSKRSKSISKLPHMNFGSMPNDGGYLVLDSEEKNDLILENAQSQVLIKPFMGSQEFINNEVRFCLWITEELLPLANSIDSIRKRINSCREVRAKSKRGSTNKLAEMPHRFGEVRFLPGEVIIVPSVSSDRRKYIPIGLLYDDTVISNLAFAIYNADLTIFGILHSMIHMNWVQVVAGRLGVGYRYSASICYNTFPFPKISEMKKKEISDAAENVLITRENYPGATMADLYDPDKMPEDLKEAHAKLDDVVESCYPGYPFANDEARLECLFKMYEKMTKEN